MVRLNLIVEGQTEREFVKLILVPYFGSLGLDCRPRLIETSRNKQKNIIYRGGCVEYTHLKNDLSRWFKQDNNKDAFFSTMIDLYKIPNSFPAFVKAKKISNPFDKVSCLEKAMQNDLKHPRFLPYIQLHEFETLLFSDITFLIPQFPHRKKGIDKLKKIQSQFSSPDLIDDGDTTAPSKRIIGQVPEYEDQKQFAGPIVAQQIGLNVLRQKCIHFNQWLEKIEKLVP